MIIIDTHIWLWFLKADKRLGNSEIVDFLKKEQKKSGLRMASISLWEISMLAAKKRIVSDKNLKTWINDALKLTNIKLINLNTDIAVDTYKLPGKFHGDPADRIIVATARHLNAKLVTADKKIIEYADKGHLEVIEV
ncbi:type II toxin-antitoxin system VapC family toxin [Patescibacteria group bacterium]|nr:type II toxin-antitoxin system VapC family toxin [Patescibacteria group bacterium]